MVEQHFLEFPRPCDDVGCTQPKLPPKEPVAASFLIEYASRSRLIQKGCAAKIRDPDQCLPF